MNKNFKGNGVMIILMGLELINMHLEIFIREIGKIECIMEKGKWNSQMEAVTKANGKIIKWMVKVNI